MNRHLYGDTLPVSADVPDCVKVVAGDLMLLCEEYHTDISYTLRTNSGLTRYAYPFAAGITATALASRATAPFLGVAMDDSPNGSTDTISVATAGVFEFPLTTQAGITIGKVIQAHVATGFSKTSQTSASYEVIQTSGSGASIGYCVKTEAGAKTARVLIRTKYGLGGMIKHS